MSVKNAGGLAILILLLAACGQSPPPEEETAAATPPVETTTEKTVYSPAVGDDLPDTVYWGDTHLHTSYSFDAGAFGNTLDPHDAYRYARGEEVTASMGLKSRLIKPLDFLVVADHSDNMGMIPDLYAGDEFA